MGKIRTKVLGQEEVEKEQKEEAKKRAEEKKLKKLKATPAQEAQAEAKANADEVAETEAEAPAKKIEKKESKEATPKKVKKQGKKHVSALKSVDAKKSYALDEALKLLKKIKYAQFEESVELHLNVTETGLKGEVELPHSTGKTVRVKIVDDKLLEDLENGKIEFDVLVSHPSFMAKLAKFARVLGPKGLMPNPKAGTVSPQPEQVAEKFSKGTLRWKTESKFPLIHQLIGKLSAEEKALSENAVAFINSVGKKNITRVTIKSTMSPGLKLNLENI